MKRRHFLKYGTGLVGAGNYPGFALAAAARPAMADTPSAVATASPTAPAASNKTTASLLVQTGEKQIVGPDFPATQLWTFNGQVPGSALRVQHGQELNVTVDNQLEVPTSVHWHGIRLPNAMDGVAGLTQDPIAPRQSFNYRFTPPDAGTYWYHSHVNAYEQVGRGLYGPLIIDEANPPQADRDLIWMIDDWRLADDASIVENFGAGHDRSHAGRIGNVPTVNGRFRDVIKVRSGERIRLRLINASNARNFALSFGNLSPAIIAIDGQPVPPVETLDPIVIGAAGRVDLMLDMRGQPESMSAVTDSFYREPFELVKFAYEKTPLRETLLDSSIALEPANLPEPVLDSSTLKQEVVIAGGAMGGLRRAMMDSKWMDLREIARQGYVWAMNDIVGNKINMPPLIDVARGTSIHLTMRNESAFPHPMHLHGHHMKLLSIDNKPLATPRWVDSPLLLPQQTMEFAFVADNPGQWLFHCHVLEHHSAGLGALVKIS